MGRGFESLRAHQNNKVKCLEVIRVTDYDVVIFGGGILGVACAIGLAHNGVSVLLVEKKEEILLNNDDRVFAVSQRSKKILEELSGWSSDHENAPIEHIMIYDEDGPAQVHYDHALVGPEPMGYVVKASELARVLQKNVSFEVNCKKECIDLIFRNDGVELTLSGGKKIRTYIVICADGKNSSLRKKIVVKELTHDFKQSCLVCNVEHEKNHNNTAIEHFYKTGPFAMLPMQGGKKTSIVWTENTKTAKVLEKLSRSEFTMALQKKCGYHLGQIELKSDVACFPISLMLSSKQVVRNVIFLGDAAHSIHPIAGQGLNLGIRDVSAVIEIIKKYKETGSDLGRTFILKEIEERRALDNTSMAMITSFMNNVFSSDLLILKLTRRIAMAAVEMSPTIKRKLIAHAMGLGEICK
ncbi:FAD-dependent monooxygenase [Anaplasma platys]|uniref:FAD-dependent monooxygenase n=1 Tax=Anaplasma platys TaxID=949 RepID=UPI001EEED0F1|nr:FAD-dependent monooxygenase [Anaplasma platys]